MRGYSLNVFCIEHGDHCCCWCCCCCHWVHSQCYVDVNKMWFVYSLKNNVLVSCNASPFFSFNWILHTDHRWQVMSLWVNKYKSCRKITWNFGYHIVSHSFDQTDQENKKIRAMEKYNLWLSCVLNAHTFIVV